MVWIDANAVYYTHDKISPVFRKDPHRGQPLECLTEDLFNGAASLEDDGLTLEAIRYHGKVRSLNKALGATGWHRTPYHCES